MKRFFRFIRVSRGSALLWIALVLVLGLLAVPLVPLLIIAPILLVFIEIINRRRRRSGDASDPPTWPNAAIKWLLPLHLVRAYFAPVILVCMFFPWALETSKPLLVAGTAALKTGWELQGLGILIPLVILLILSLYYYLARPFSPRLVARWFFGSIVIIALADQIDSAVRAGFLDFTTTIEETQPAHTLASSISSFYILSAIYEAGILFWNWLQRDKILAPATPASEPDILASAGPQEVVLLIHGTGAAAVEDRGSAWWQTGSNFVSRQASLLPTRIRIHGEGEVFHWSGKNSEAERRQSGHALFEYLRRLQDKNVSVHLIGHSHGGSVILYALKRAVAKRVPLSNLMSWTTFGTPFIHYKTDLSNIPLLMIPIGVASVLFLSGDILEHILETWSHLFNEGYYPTLAALVALSIGVGLIVGINLLRLFRLLFSYARLHRNNRLEMRAMDRYGHSWKCFWSKSDEAIGGLQRATGFEGGLILPIPSDQESLTGRMRAAATAPVRYFFNHLGRPVLNDLISGRLRRFVQGNDDGIAEVYNVSPWPHGGKCWPPLPPEIEKLAVATANTHSAESLSALRSLLGTGAIAPLEMPSMTFAVAGQLTGQELIHCGYYELDAVLDDVANHISSCSERVQQTNDESGEISHSVTRRHEIYHTESSSRPAGLRLTGWLTVGLQLVVLASLVSVLHLLDSTVLDRFRTDRQVKEALYSSLNGSVTHSLEAGNADAVLEFLNEINHFDWHLAGDPRIELVAFIEMIKEGRFSDAESALPQFTHPFFATTAYTVLEGASPDNADPEKLSLSPDLDIDIQPFTEIAPSINHPQILDGLVKSAMRFRGWRMRPDPLDVGLRKIFGRLDWGWIADSSTASARQAAELSYLHFRSWAGDQEAREEIRYKINPKMSQLSLLETILQDDAATGEPLEDRVLDIAVAVARSPYDVERRMLALLLIEYGRWPEVLRIAERLFSTQPSVYGSDRQFDDFVYFARTATLEAHARGEIPEEQRDSFPYPLLRSGASTDFWNFSNRVGEIAKKIADGKALESYETVGNVEGLKTYGLLKVVETLLDTGMRTQALMMAQTTLTDLSSGYGSMHSDSIQADEFKRLAVLYAEANELYMARKIAESFVSKEDRLEVWTAILRSYRERFMSEDVDYTTHMSDLLEEVDRERGMRRSFDAPWNDNSW